MFAGGWKERLGLYSRHWRSCGWRSSRRVEWHWDGFGEVKCCRLFERVRCHVVDPLLLVFVSISIMLQRGT